jgi:hypothetical protein
MAGRMKLENVVSGKIETPYRICLYGPEGIGKSTFASQAPSPIFLGAEDGTNEIDTNRFPPPKEWSEIFEAISTLRQDSHDYKTLVIDTLDACQPLCWEAVCATARKKHIEEFDYGKGYTAAVDRWRELSIHLDLLRKQRGMNIILLAHSDIKKHKNPEGEDYDRYILMLHEKSAAIIKRWVDALLFTNYETFTTEKDGRAKGVDRGARLIYTERRAAFDAKNRFGLPPKLSLSYDEFQLAREIGPGPPEQYLKEIAALAEKASDDIKEKVNEYVKKAGKNALNLSKTLDWLRAKVTTNESNETV